MLFLSHRGTTGQMVLLPVKTAALVFGLSEHCTDNGELRTVARRLEAPCIAASSVEVCELGHNPSARSGGGRERDLPLGPGGYPAGRHTGTTYIPLAVGVAGSEICS